MGTLRFLSAGWRAGIAPDPSQTRLKTYDTVVDTLWRRLWRAGLLMAMAVGLVFYGFYYALVTPWGLVQMCMPLALMMLIIIWALPDMTKAPTLLVQRLLFAYVICLVLWPNYLAISLPGLPWITLVRLTGFPLVLALLISLSVSQKFRSEMFAIRNATPVLFNLVMVFSVLMIVSVGVSSTPMTSIQKLIVALVNWIAIFAAGAWVFSKPGNTKRWAYVMLVVFAAMCIVGLVDARYHKVPWADHVPPFLKIGDPVVERMISSAYRSANGEYRVKGVFTTPLALAEFMALCLPIVLHLFLGSFPKLVRLSALVLLPIGYVVIESTGSRLGMVGSIVGVLLYTLQWGFIRWRKVRTSVIAPAVLMAYPVFAVLLVAASFTSNYLKRRVWGDGATAASDAGREAQLQLGLPKVMSHPWGYGIGRGAETLGIRGAGDVLTIDNYFLSILLEYGVIGFVVFYGMIVAAVVYGWMASIRSSEDPEVSLAGPLAVSLSTFIVIKWVFSQQDNHSLMFLMMGAVAGLAWRQRAEAAALAATTRLAAPIVARSRLLGAAASISTR